MQKGKCGEEEKTPELHKTLEQQCAHYCVYHGKDICGVLKMCAISFAL